VKKITMAPMGKFNKLFKMS